MFDAFKNLIKRISNSSDSGLAGRKSDLSNHLEFSVRVEYYGREPPSVPKELLEEEYRKIKFVTENEPAPVTTKNRWFNPNRKINKNIQNLPRWMSPVLPKIDFDDEAIRGQLLLGPDNLRNVATAVRRRIKSRMKKKVSVRDELDFLYRVAVFDDFIKAFTISIYSWSGYRDIIPHLAKEDLKYIRVDYQAIGYKHLSLLNATDVKWIREQIGEPREHNLVADIFSDIVNKAVSRYLWSKFREESSSRLDNGGAPLVIEKWLRDYTENHLERKLADDEEKERRQQQRYLESKVCINVQQSIEIFSENFLVLDLETSGLNPNSDSIIEIGAIKVLNDFGEYKRFSTLIQFDGKLPHKIRKLTGITDEELRRKAVSPARAIEELRGFVGELPVFCHNATFDLSFLQNAFEQCGSECDMQIFDTLKIFRSIWPELPSYRLESLCRHFSIRNRNAHRALGDCEALVKLIKIAVGENWKKR